MQNRQQQTWRNKMKTVAKQKCKLYLAVIGAVFSFAMSIASFVTAQQSYALLNEVKGDFEIHIDHWNALPLLDVKIISEAAECPNDYETPIVSDDKNALQTIGEFPGSLPWCDCADTGFDWTFTYTQFWCECNGCKSYNGTTYCSTSPGAGQCSSNANKAGCYSQSQLATKTVTYYTESGSCHTNATKAGCANDDPLDSVDLNVWKAHKLCYKRGGYSAMDRAETGCDVVCQSANSEQDETNTICAQSLEECPLILLGNLSEAIDSNSVLDSEINVTANGNENYLPIVEIRTSIGSPCWKGDFGQPGRTNNERVANKFSGSCSTDDSRFETWDLFDETSLYNENSVPTSGNNFMPGNSQYSPVQYYNESSSVNWQISFRRQIFWKSTCAVGDIKKLADHLKPLKKTVSYQHTLLVINGIFGLGILGIFIPAVMILHAMDKDHDLMCVPGEGQQERDNINRIKTYCGLIAKFAKMVPLILCIIVTDSIHWFFFTAGNSDCSDALTNDSMSDLGTQIDKVKKSNWNTLWIDIALICWTLIGIARWIHKRYCRKEKALQTSAAQNNNNNQVNNTEVVCLQAAPNQPQAIELASAPPQQYVQEKAQVQQFQPGSVPQYIQPPQAVQVSQPLYQNPNQIDYKQMFASLDMNGDGFISLDEFMRGIGAFVQNEDAARMKFWDMDTNKDGMIDFNEFRQAYNTLELIPPKYGQQEEAPQSEFCYGH